MSPYANDVNTHGLGVRPDGNAVDPDVKGYDYQPDVQRPKKRFAPHQELIDTLLPHASKRVKFSYSVFDADYKELAERCGRDYYARDEINELHTKTRERDEEIEKLKASLKAKDEELASANQSISELSKTNECVSSEQQRRHAVEGERDAAHQQLESARSLIAEKDAALNQQYEAARQAIDSARSEITQKDDQLSEAHQKRVEAETLAAQLQQNLEQLQQVLEERNNHAEHQSEQRVAAEKERDSCQEENVHLKEVISNLNKTVDDLKKELQSSEIKLHVVSGQRDLTNDLLRAATAKISSPPLTPSDEPASPTSQTDMPMSLRETPMVDRSRHRLPMETGNFLRSVKSNSRVGKVDHSKQKSKASSSLCKLTEEQKRRAFAMRATSITGDDDDDDNDEDDDSMPIDSYVDDPDEILDINDKYNDWDEDLPEWVRQQRCDETIRDYRNDWDMMEQAEEWTLN